MSTSKRTFSKTIAMTIGASFIGAIIGTCIFHYAANLFGPDNPPTPLHKLIFGMILFLTNLLNISFIGLYMKIFNKKQ
jgi:hypothetical protein